MTQPDNQPPFPSDGTPPTQSAYPPPSPYPAAPPAYPGYGGDPYNPYGAPTQPRNGLGLAGMVLGILSIVLCFLNWIDVIVAILAIVFSAIGRSRVKKGAATNKGQATAGLICGVIGAVLAIVITVWAFGKAKDCMDKYPDRGPAYTQCIQNSFTGNS